LGDRAMLLALNYYVYRVTGSTLATAAMFAAYYVPTMLFGSMAGVFVDRWDRKRIMVITNLAQALVTSLLLLVRSPEWLWVAYAVLFAQTTLSTFFEPAESALLPSLVEEEQLVPANALNALNNNIARLAGPPVGGVLLGLFGLGSVAVIDAASFLLAAALISPVSPPRRRAAEIADVIAVTGSALGRTWREWLEGMALVRRDRLIATLFLVTVITSFGGCMFDPVFAPWVLSVLRQGPEMLGLLSTVGAVGGLVGGVLLGRFGARFLPGQLFGWGSAGAGAILLVMYQITFLPVVLALSFLKSIPLVGSGAGLNTLFQTLVPDRYLGRVYGALGTANALIGLVSLAIAGFLAELLGIVPVLSLASGLTIFAGVLGLVLLPRGERPSEPAGASGVEAASAP
ncbi:MAG: MFS transporter, partial [Chloroflexota bacterium]|nr:MFS transporter [Chloroflexota bacterium]